MSSIPNDLASSGDAAQVSRLSEADRALLLAMRAWADDGALEASGAQPTRKTNTTSS